jgi:hypothetical protein
MGVGECEYGRKHARTPFRPFILSPPHPFSHALHSRAPTPPFPHSQPWDSNDFTPVPVARRPRPKLPVVLVDSALARIS